jgi:purine-binding chemotaxis protein CheW
MRMPDALAGAKPGGEFFILFQLAGTTYAVPSRVVQQMEMLENLTPVPRAAPYVAGVAYLRGQVIPAVDLRTRFGFPRVPYDLRTRLIIIQAAGRTVGLIADTAREFVTIPTEAIQPPHDAIGGLSGRYLQGVASLNGRLVLILNAEAVLSAPDPVLIADAAGDVSAAQPAG